MSTYYQMYVDLKYAKYVDIHSKVRRQTLHVYLRTCCKVRRLEIHSMSTCVGEVSRQ